MHLSNNAFALFFNNYGESSTGISLLYMGFIYGGLLTVVVTLFTHFKKLRSFLRSERSFRAMLKTWCTTPAVIVITVLFVALTVLSIFE